MRRAKNWWLFGGAVVIGLSLAACSARRQAPETPALHAPVPETGVVHEVSDRNGELIFARPGDVITVALTADANSGFQWSYRSPIAGGYVSLKRHLVTEIKRPGLAGQWRSVWDLKIEKPATFDVRLEYENPQRRRNPVAERFFVKVVSDRTVEKFGWLLVDSPAANSLARGSLKAAGFAQAAAGPVSLTVMDADGVTLATAEIKGPADGPEFFGFDQEVAFSAPATPVGSVRFTAAKSDGRTPPSVEIPLVFLQDVSAVKVFWGNQRLNPEPDCGRVFGVTRGVPKDGDLLRDALAMLVSGPTASDRSSGYFTSLPAGVKPPVVALKDGVATLQFTRGLERGVAGSCRVTAIRQQIVQTAQQFSSVSSVVIAVDGRTDDVLQP